MCKKKLISIIIPFFNAEKYILRCLESVINQNVDANFYEIILVDDGSNDKSLSIVNCYIESYNNIFVYSKENGGVSTARNLGIEKSSSDFILFIDADDEIEDGSLQKIMNNILSNSQIEVFICKSNKYSSVGDHIMECYPFGKNLFDKTYTSDDLYKMSYLRGSACGAVFNRLFLVRNNIEFPCNIINAEDTIFMMQCLLFSIKIKFLDILFYKVYVNEFSASMNWNYERIDRMVDVLGVINSINNSHQFTNYKRSIINKYTVVIIGSILNYLILINECSKYRNIKSKIVKSGIYPLKLTMQNLVDFKLLLMNTSLDFSFLLIYIKSKFRK